MYRLLVFKLDERAVMIYRVLILALTVSASSTLYAIAVWINGYEDYSLSLLGSGSSSLVFILLFTRYNRLITKYKSYVEIAKFVKLRGDRIAVPLAGALIEGEATICKLNGFLDRGSKVLFNVLKKNNTFETILDPSNAVDQFIVVNDGDDQEYCIRGKGYLIEHGKCRTILLPIYPVVPELGKNLLKIRLGRDYAEIRVKPVPPHSLYLETVYVKNKSSSLKILYKLPDLGCRVCNDEYVALEIREPGSRVFTIPITVVEKPYLVLVPLDKALIKNTELPLSEIRVRNRGDSKKLLLGFNGVRLILALEVPDKGSIVQYTLVKNKYLELRDAADSTA